MKIWRIKAPVWALVGGASLLTLALIGAVVVVATPAGCQAAQRFGVHVNQTGCGVSQTSVLSPSPGPSGYVPSSPSAPLPEVPTPSTPTPSHSPYPPYEYPASVVGGPPLTVIATAPLPVIPGLTCRLPIYAGPPGSGGFVVFPGGSFVADPRSGVALPSPGASLPSQYFTGVYQPGLTYDHAHDRWLPVQRSWVLADGTRYAWPGTSGIYVANASDGTVTKLGEGHPWGLLGLDSTGAYTVVPYEEGLWLLPFSGAPRQITAAGFWTVIGGDAAYGRTLPPDVVEGANPILRLDLKTGTSTQWFMLDDTSSFSHTRLLGLDSTGIPIVYTSSQYLVRIWLVPTLGGAKVIATLNPSGVVFYFFNGSPVADAHGIWFGTNEAMLLWVPDRGWYQMARIGGNLAGGCA